MLREQPSARWLATILPGKPLYLAQDFPPHPCIIAAVQPGSIPGIEYSYERGMRVRESAMVFIDSSYETYNGAACLRGFSG